MYARTRMTPWRRYALLDYSEPHYGRGDETTRLYASYYANIIAGDSKDTNTEHIAEMKSHRDKNYVVYNSITDDNVAQEEERFLTEYFGGDTERGYLHYHDDTVCNIEGENLVLPAGSRVFVYSKNRSRMAVNLVDPEVRQAIYQFWSGRIDAVGADGMFADNSWNSYILKVNINPNGSQGGRIAEIPTHPIANSPECTGIIRDALDALYNMFIDNGYVVTANSGWAGIPCNRWLEKFPSPQRDYTAGVHASLEGFIAQVAEDDENTVASMYINPGQNGYTLDQTLQALVAYVAIAQPFVPVSFDGPHTTHYHMGSNAAQIALWKYLHMNQYWHLDIPDGIPTGHPTSPQFVLLDSLFPDPITGWWQPQRSYRLYHIARGNFVFLYWERADWQDRGPLELPNMSRSLVDVMANSPYDVTNYRVVNPDGSLGDVHNYRMSPGMGYVLQNRYSEFSNEPFVWSPTQSYTRLLHVPTSSTNMPLNTVPGDTLVLRCTAVNYNPPFNHLGTVVTYEATLLDDDGTQKRIIKEGDPR